MRRVPVVGGAAVRRLLPMGDCIGLMRTALAAHGRGEAVLPLRPVVPVPDGRGSLYVMPAWVGEPEALAVKLVTLFPGNAGTAHETHQGVVVLFGEHGEAVALIDAASVTAIRTAAVSAVATDLLARRDAHTLCILGSGVQARSHVHAMRAVRDIREIRVWSRTEANARAFAEELAADPSLDVVRTDARSAVRGADIVCTVTGAREAIVHGDWLQPGAHINAVGASTAVTRELDGEAVARARVWVDSRESAWAEAGDLLLAHAEGKIDRDHVCGTIGELLLGRAAGRESEDDITLFESLGLAVEDAAAARLIAERARDVDLPRVDFD